MPIRDVTFENMIACYAKCISLKYTDSWGVYNDVKQHPDDIFKQGYILGIINSYRDQFCKMIIDNFEKMREYETCFSMSVTVSSHDDIVNEEDDDEETIIIDDIIVRLHNNLITINLHNLSGWKQNDYVVTLFGDNVDMVTTAVSECLKMVGTLIHRYGVDSQRHNELGISDETFKGEMFKAMVYENMLEELYEALENVYNNSTK